MEGVFIQAYLSGATSLSLSLHPAIFDVSEAAKQSTTRVSQNLLLLIYTIMVNSNKQKSFILYFSHYIGYLKW